MIFRDISTMETENCKGMDTDYTHVALASSISALGQNFEK